VLTDTYIADRLPGRL